MEMFSSPYGGEHLPFRLRVAALHVRQGTTGIAYNFAVLAEDGAETVRAAIDQELRFFSGVEIRHRGSWSVPALARSWQTFQVVPIAMAHPVW